MSMDAKQFQLVLQEKLGETLLRMKQASARDMQVRYCPDGFSLQLGYPAAIHLNQGWCRDFAWAVCQAVNGDYGLKLLAEAQASSKDKVLYVQDGNCECQSVDLNLGDKFVHTAILWNDQWFDAECLFGVSTPEELPFFNHK